LPATTDIIDTCTTASVVGTAAELPATRTIVTKKEEKN
jgi:hypothetical protein